jgi:hypothetical protein
MIRNAYRILLVLWAGSLWSLALWVARTLFAQPDRHLAGLLAARLFTVETYLGLAVAVLGFAWRAQLRPVYVAAALLCVNEWVFKRFMEQAQAQGAALGLSFGAWHGVSAVGYVIGCLLVAWVIWKGRI